MHKHENRASSLVNLQKTKQAPSYFVSVFLGLLTVSYYSIIRMPVGWSNAWLPPPKCCTWNTRCHYPATRALGIQFVEKTCASHKPLPFSRGQWSCMHTAASLQTVFGLFISVQIIWWSQKLRVMENRLMPCPAAADRMHKIVSSFGRCTFYFLQVLGSCPMEQIIIHVFTSEG